MLDNGGCDFAADPHATALIQPVLWIPQIDPSAILLEPGPAPHAGFHLTASDLIGQTISDRISGPFQVELPGGRFDICLPTGDDENALAVLVPLDDLTPDRLSALERFWAAITGRYVPPDPRMTPQRRNRARQMLRAVDARSLGETYRAIAEVLYPEHETEPAAWVGSAIRETTIRLARDGMKLVRGGYRLLLRRPRRER